MHDVGDYRVGDVWRELEAGMVLTIEPGLYVPDSDSYALPWRGMGIRIEDDLIVQENGVPYNLMGSIPIEVDEIETLMNE